MSMYNKHVAGFQKDNIIRISGDISGNRFW